MRTPRNSSLGARRENGHQLHYRDLAYFPRFCPFLVLAIFSLVSALCFFPFIALRIFSLAAKGKPPGLSARPNATVHLHRWSRPTNTVSDHVLPGATRCKVGLVAGHGPRDQGVLPAASAA